MLAEGIFEQNDLKAAFIRDGNLWTLINNEEKQITSSEKVFTSPQWSHDGQWLLYQNEAPSEYQDGEKQNEIWVYHVKTGQKTKIYYDGYSPTWAPDKNIVAYLDSETLDISDLKRFYNVAMGVNSYTWLTDGSGFLLSSRANLLPSGWTNPILYKKKLNNQYENILLYGDTKEMFTIPKELGEGDKSILSIHASNFTFSPSNKWISFIVSPTASWSMDSNMLCVISSNGKKFDVLDEVIFGVGKPKWAPTKDTIAFIAGGGRIVFGFKNKHLKVKEMPVSGSLTPQDYAELDFTWINNKYIVTSRVKEKEWSNDSKQHPLPSLYSINIEDNNQKRITNPPKGFGDYQPKWIKSANKLLWFRGKTLFDEDRDIWVSELDGTNAKKWLENVNLIEFYEE
jgi:Tol biopolymer transport system component